MIFNISPFSQLRIILASVKCRELKLGNMDVSEVDARSRTLVTATKDQVKTMTLSSVYIVKVYLL